MDHPRFALILALWGGALGAGGVLALSSVDIARISMVVGLGALGALVKLVYAAVAGLVGGLVLFALATLIARHFSPRSHTCFFATLGEDRIHPIDPAADLGSESLDAPLETMPFAGAQEAEFDEPELGEEEIFEEGARDEPPPLELETHMVAEPFEGDDLASLEPSDDHEKRDDREQHDDREPQAETQSPGLNFDAFTRIMANETEVLETRLSKVETPALQASDENVASFAQPGTGIEKLRSVPPEDLSLVQLVERFAAALHEAQDAATGDLAKDHAANGNAERERALATALKALDLFTKDGVETQTNAAKASAGAPSAIGTAQSELRAALSELQSVKGAA